jgi:hypothetical protein
MTNTPSAMTHSTLWKAEAYKKNNIGLHKMTTNQE